jgi:hypothetical protein
MSAVQVVRDDNGKEVKIRSNRIHCYMYILQSLQSRPGLPYLLGMGIQSLDSCQILDHYKEAHANKRPGLVS